MVLGEHQDGHQRGAGDQQHRLDDLHPGGALHPADGDVDDHQRTDRDDRPALGGAALDAQQQGDQRARADHLGEQVEDRDHDGGDAGRGAHRPLAHPEGQHVGHRVAAGVAQRFGDQQQGDQPGHQEADGVEEAVVAEQRDGAGDAEEGRGGHVVAGDGQAVLEAGEAPAAGVEVGGVLGLAAGPDRDAQGGEDEEAEQRHRQAAVLGGGGGQLCRGQRGGHSPASRGAWTVAWSKRSRMAVAGGSSLRSAYRAYQAAIAKVVRN